MGEAIITWICFGIIFFAVKNFLNHKKNKKSDLSLGINEIQNVRNLIENENFEDAENLIKKFNTDFLTQTLDYVGLTVNILKLLKWKNQSNDLEIPNLFIGVFYLHSAWICRSHSFSSKVSTKNRNLFFENQEKSQEFFEKIPNDSVFISQVYSRLIRLEMGNEGFNETATYYYEKAKNLDNDNVWTYLHYCELIQPKWGGNIEEITSFLESLPDNFFIKSTVKLKLMLDSFIISENYFNTPSLKNFIYNEILKIDYDCDNNEIASIHKYILFNYMYLLSLQVRHSALEKKYKVLSNGYHTLYPHGVTI